MNILFKLSKAARDDHCGKRIFRETLWFLKFKFYWISAVTIFQNIIKTENIFYFFPPQIDNFHSLFMGEKTHFLVNTNAPVKIISNTKHLQVCCSVVFTLYYRSRPGGHIVENFIGPGFGLYINHKF